MVDRNESSNIYWWFKLWVIRIINEVIILFKIRLLEGMV